MSPASAENRGPELEVIMGNYVLRPPEALALRALRAQIGVRALLLEGPPGCGKTYFGEYVAEQLGAELVFCLLHSWSDDQELFYGVDVVAAVAGDAQNVRVPGVLSLAAQLSHERQVVVLLDELDKAPERVENLLLDVLQSGRVPTAPGRYQKVVLENTIFALTTNGTRPHSDALLRRVRRVRMAPLAVPQLNELAAAQSGAGPAVVHQASKLARLVAEKDHQILSVQELTVLCRELVQVAASLEEARLLVEQWACRGAAGVSWLHSQAGTAALAPLWGEVQAARRRVP